MANWSRSLAVETLMLVVPIPSDTQKCKLGVHMDLVNTHPRKFDSKSKSTAAPSHKLNHGAHYDITTL